LDAEAGGKIPLTRFPAHPPIVRVKRAQLPLSLPLTIAASESALLSLIGSERSALKAEGSSTSICLADPDLGSHLLESRKVRDSEQ
jgi:hypothetical protein